MNEQAEIARGPAKLSPQEREYIIESLRWSQSLAGIEISRAQAERSLNKALAGPLPVIP